MSEFIYSVEGLFDSSTRKGCLQQHSCKAFHIPPYQRGYKWGSEINQPVDRLLSDLYKAWREDKNEYLLQAITVKRIPFDTTTWVLEVIDGQQRLTTLFILCYALNIRLKDRTNLAGKLQ